MAATLTGIVCLAFLVLGQFVETEARLSAEDYLNMCIRLPNEYSKARPSPEPDVECIRYRDESCCKPNMTTSFLEDHQWMNMTDYGHCPQKPRLSPECERLTHDEMCFFACSPNSGPWIVRGKEYPYSDRYNQLPVCASQCDKWWNACKEEYTCHRNWFTDPAWDANGMNICPKDAVCKKYTEVYTSAADFCNTIWDGGYHVVPDTEPCMEFSFDPAKPNPNVPVARAAAEKKAAVSEASSLKMYPPSGVFVLYTLFLLCTPSTLFYMKLH
ncbi:folate receptor alpha-like [Lingula anatina]|uniref:Folate receptor alpha-like n=1 Tax=Lingula anatina TaxID=7574 RepID=A0A1S3HG53_LINAN|nr:folate receptor alpha-like [Lingula anatina]|eukprot:XP_013385040.1 folate receptor alpha-like [Lingula anatina]